MDGSDRRTKSSDPFLFDDCLYDEQKYKTVIPKKTMAFHSKTDRFEHASKLASRNHWSDYHFYFLLIWIVESSFYITNQQRNRSNSNAYPPYQQA